MVKNPPANAGDVRDMGLIPGLGRSPGEGKGYPLQYSGLENSMDCIDVALAVKNPSANAGDVRDMGSIPGSGRSPGEAWPLGPQAHTPLPPQPSPC